MKKSTRSSLRAAERFLLNWGIAILGVAISLLGIIFLIVNNYGNGSLSGILQSLLTPVSESAFNPESHSFPASLFFSLALHFIPGLLPFAILLFIHSKGETFKKILLSSGILLLILAEAKIFLLNAYHYGSFFPGFWPALIWMMVIQVLLTLFAAFRRIGFALVISVVHFFVSIALLRSYFGGLLPYFLLLSIFQAIVLRLSVRSRWRTPFVLSQGLSALYISYYILTRIILPAEAGPVSYMLPSALIWLIITVTGAAILKTGSSRKIKLLLWDSISYLSPFLVAALSYFSIKTAGKCSLCMAYECGALAVLIVLALLNLRYEWFRSTRGFYFAACIMAASVIPYLLFDHYLMVFAAALPVAAIVHSHLSGSPGSFGFSKALIAVMLFVYAAELAFRIIPALSESRLQVGPIPFHSVLGAIVVASLTWFYIRFHDYASANNRYLDRNNAVRVNIALYILPVIAWSASFLLLDFILSNLFSGYGFNLNEAALTAYAALWITLTTCRNNNVKISTASIIISYSAILLYPFVVQPGVSDFRDLFTEGERSALLPFLLHYITLSFVTLLLFELNKQLLIQFPKTRSIKNFTRLAIVSLAAFVLITEYDNLSVLVPGFRGSMPVSEILSSNRFIPWSVIFLLESIAVLIWAVSRNLRFMRRAAMAMMIIALLKILVIDIRIASGNTLVAILIPAGLMLIAISYMVRRMREKRKREAKERAREQISSR